MLGKGTSEPNALLRVCDLTVRFYTSVGVATAVDGVSFKLEPGERLGIVGESGSGKSATALAILGLIDPPGTIEAGSVQFHGQELVGLSERAYRAIRGSGIGLVLQDPLSSLNPVMRIGAQLAEVIRTHHAVSREDAYQSALSRLHEVGMPEAERQARSYPHELSGGMRQRVAIAAALCGDPELLIADEPTTALDVSIQAEILALLKRLGAGRGMGVILITHDLGVLAGFVDNVLVMYAGRAMEYSDRYSLFKNPSHPYTIGLLESLSRIDRPPPKRLPVIGGAPPDLTSLPPGCFFHPRCFLYEDQGEEACRLDAPPFRQPRTAPGHLVSCHLAEKLVE